MNIKIAIKKAVELTKIKRMIPIQHNVDSMEILQDKVAVIIGGSGGIGLSIAKSFSESGCKVILCGTNQSKLEMCVEGFQNQKNVHSMIFNVEDMASIKANVAAAVGIFGKVDILVNSAGVHTEDVNFFTMTPEEYDRVMNVNIKGPFFVCQEFSKYMMQNQIGVEKSHILIISSSRGSEPAWSPYGISKWALNGLIRGLAQMLLPYGIIVNGISPGATATELIGIKEDDSIYSTENGEGRLIMPDEIANVAKLLVGPAGDMIVGETIHVSGGRGVFDIR
mgnify:FL=1